MIDTLLNTKKLNYASHLNGDSLKQKIETIFDQSNLSFVGRFTNQNEFAAYDKWTYISWYVPNFRRKTAYLKGEITQVGKGTHLKLNIRPNPVISIFPILTIIIGIITIIVTAASNENNKNFIFGLIIIAVGILFYLLGIFLNTRLRNNFKKYLDLQKI